LLRAAGRARGARERRSAGERVDERGLADVRAAGEGDFDRPYWRQAVGARRREDELAGTCEQVAPRLGPVGRNRCFDHTLGVFAGLLLLGNSLARLSNSSIFTPAFFMIRDCWSTVSVLFQVQ